MSGLAHKQHPSLKHVRLQVPSSKCAFEPLRDGAVSSLQASEAESLVLLAVSLVSSTEVLCDCKHYCDVL